ncbi:unnamed protein product, partial [Amoebophrya sp. A25]
VVRSINWESRALLLSRDHPLITALLEANFEPWGGQRRTSTEEVFPALPHHTASDSRESGPPPQIEARTSPLDYSSCQTQATVEDREKAKEEEVRTSENYSTKNSCSTGSTRTIYSTSSTPSSFWTRIIKDKVDYATIPVRRRFRDLFSSRGQHEQQSLEQGTTTARNLNDEEKEK